MNGQNDKETRSCLKKLAKTSNDQNALKSKHCYECGMSKVNKFEYLLRNRLSQIRS